MENSSVIPPGYIMAKTPGAAQRILSIDDKPNEYPCTPQEFEDDPLGTYADNLSEGADFFRNHNGAYVVVDKGFSKDHQSLYVLTKSAYVYIERGDNECFPVPIAELSEEEGGDIDDLPHALTEVSYEYGLFVHEKIGLGFYPTEELKELFTEYTQGE